MLDVQQIYDNYYRCIRELASENLKLFVDAEKLINAKDNRTLAFKTKKQKAQIVITKILT